MEILRTEHLCKIYGEGENRIHAVDDANISVAQGEFVAGRQLGQREIYIAAHIGGCGQTDLRKGAD